MEKLFNAGRVFYGISMAGLGLQTVYFHDFPYMLIPPTHYRIPCLTVISSIFGGLLLLAGASIAIKVKTRLAALLLGVVLLLIFCFYFIPYQFFTNRNYMHLIEWDNPAKELALAGGALVIAGCFPANNKSVFEKLLANALPLRVAFFCLPMVSFGLFHFIYGKNVAGYIPEWIPNRVFWGYAAGVPLFCSGMAILLNIRRRLMAIVLGAVIFTWFIILHIPKAFAEALANMGSEATSALLALAYCGIAFVIAGLPKTTAAQTMQNIKPRT